MDEKQEDGGLYAGVEVCEQLISTLSVVDVCVCGYYGLLFSG